MVLLCGCLFLEMWLAWPGASPGYPLLLEVLLYRDGDMSSLSFTPFPHCLGSLLRVQPAGEAFSDSQVETAPISTAVSFLYSLLSSSHHLKCY